MADTQSSVALTSATQVTVTMSQLIWGVLGLGAVVVAAVSGITAYATAGIKEDVGLIRASVQESAKSFNSADKDGILRLRDAESKLAEQISGLRIDLVGLRGDLSQTNKSIS